MLGAARNQGWKGLKVIVVVAMAMVMNTVTAEIERKAVKARDAIANDEARA